MDTQGITDAGLMPRIALSDTQAFGELYEVYRPMIGDYLLARTGRREGVEDMSQEVFMRLWAGRRRFRGSSSAKTYLFSIARNVLREDRRRRTKKPPAGGNEDECFSLLCCDDCPPPESALRLGETVELVERVKGRLSPAQREAIDLVFAGQHTIAEAAGLAGCNGRQMQNRLYRATRRLREILCQAGQSCTA